MREKNFLSVMFVLLAGFPVTKTQARIDQKVIVLGCAGIFTIVGGTIATYLSYKQKKFYQDKFKRLKPILEELITLEEEADLTDQQQALKRKLSQEVETVLTGLSISKINTKDIQAILENKERRWLWATI